MRLLFLKNKINNDENVIQIQDDSSEDKKEEFRRDRDDNDGKPNKDGNSVTNLSTVHKEKQEI